MTRLGACAAGTQIGKMDGWPGSADGEPEGGGGRGRGEEALGSFPAPGRGGLSSGCRVKMRPFLVPPRPPLSIGSPARPLLTQEQIPWRATNHTEVRGET